MREARQAVCTADTVSLDPLGSDFCMSVHMYIIRGIKSQNCLMGVVLFLDSTVMSIQMISDLLK